MQQVDDMVLRANAIPTMSLGEAVARQYGISRDDKSVLLLVSVRQGEPSREVSLEADIRATATDLLGRKQVVQMRRVGIGEFVDYVGSVQVIPPDTLHFIIDARPKAGIQANDGLSGDATAQPRTMDLAFNRDFFP